MLAPRSNSPLKDVTGNRALLPTSRIDELQVVSGHSLAERMAGQFGDRPVKESVLIREPVSWFLSFYNYRVDRMQNGTSPHPGLFEEWYARNEPNPICRFLLRRYFGVGYPRIFAYSSRDLYLFLHERLARFHFVGDIVHTTKLVAHVSEAVRTPTKFESTNVTRSKVIKRGDFGDTFVEEIYARNRADLALYSVWKDRCFDQGAPDLPTEILESLPHDDQFSGAVSDARASIMKKLHRR